MEHVIALERELLSPMTRANPARLRELIADDFHEFGASGAEYAAQDVVKAATAVALSSPPRIEVDQMFGWPLAEGLVLIKYVSMINGLRINRTSIWRRDASGWRIMHHQGTPVRV